MRRDFGVGYTGGVTGKTQLSDPQKRRAARIAQDEGLVCPDCGSSEPVPTDAVRAHADGGAAVAMRCEDCKNATEMTLVLSPEEAKALGLHALRDLPEAPDTSPPGGATSG
jgi:hypothetical protein